MTNNTDYTRKSQTVTDLLPSRFKTNFNESLFSNTVDKFFTKTELVRVLGTIGVNSTRVIAEDNAHAQAYQLQPLIYKNVATVNYLNSFKDIMNELEIMGVNPNRFEKWGNTTTFNFAPPIDVDKLINYSEYYWVDTTGDHPIPQYITIRNLANVATAKLIQKQKEVNLFPVDTSYIEDVSLIDNSITLAGDLVKFFNTGSLLTITNSTSNNGAYNVDNCSLVDNNTVIVLIDSLIDDDVSGMVNINNQLDAFTADAAAYSISAETNDWIRDNKWVNRRDLLETEISFATQATFPIIEYSEKVELNEWSKIKHNWMFRQSINHPWVVSESPTLADIYTDINVDRTINPTFHDLWLYVDSEDLGAAATPVITGAPIMLSSDSVDLELILTTNTTNNPDDTYNFPSLPSDPLILPRDETALAGTNAICVYVDGKRQYDNYVEILDITDTFVVGVLFNETQTGVVSVLLGSVAEVDDYLENVEVRTSATGSPYTSLVNLMTYFKTEQTKDYGEIKYPLFNIYDIDDVFVEVNSIFTFKTDTTSDIVSEVNERVALDSNLKPIFTQQLIKQDNGILYYYHETVEDILE